MDTGEKYIKSTEWQVEEQFKGIIVGDMRILPLYLFEEKNQ